MSKKIFPSSGNGKGAESSVVTVDENNGNVSAASVTASYITVDGLNGLAKISSGQISSLDITTAQSGNILQSQGGQFIPTEASLQALGGDLDGLVSNATVNSISNVTSGTLAVNVGGTGKNDLISGSILVLNQSNIDATSGSLLTVNSDGNVWQATGSALLEVVPLAEPIVYLYTGSVGYSNTFTWIKPVGTRFVRVICQGGGGGGGAGGRGSTNTTYRQGYGGGGGGFCDITLNGLSLPDNIIITAGAGGVGATTNYGYGTNGASSSFGTYIYSNGGLKGLSYSSGINSTSNSFTVGAGGAGCFNGGGGSTYRTDSPSVVRGAPGGACGLDYGLATRTNYYDTGDHDAGGITSYNIPQGKGGLLFQIALSPRPPELDGQVNSDYLIKPRKYWLNTSGWIEDDNFPKLLCSGGGGGGQMQHQTQNYRSGDGGSPLFGAGGGGGGGCYTTGSVGSGGYAGYGGNGGKGYVLIICY